MKISTLMLHLEDGHYVKDQFGSIFKLKKDTNIIMDVEIGKVSFTQLEDIIANIGNMTLIKPKIKFTIEDVYMRALEMNSAVCLELMEVDFNKEQDILFNTKVKITVEEVE